jgi:hypothetical protein
VEREQIDLNIGELETRLDRLRALYEHYFMGIERIEPSVARKDVERRVADLRKARFQSTAQRFKFQTIVQRYNTMQQHWSRICREIELGTFRRHRLKAEQTFASRPPPTPKAAEAMATPATEIVFRAQADSITDVDFPPVELGTGTAAAPPELMKTPGAGMLSRLRDSGTSPLVRGLGASLPPDLGARAAKLPPAPQVASLGPAPVPTKPKEARPADARPADPKPPEPARPIEQPAAKAADQLPEARVRALHQAYVDARKQTNASAVSFEKLERSLRETEAKLKGTHQGRTVDFEVVIKDGKAILKPKLK